MRKPPALNNPTDIEEHIQTLLQREQVDFLTVKQVLTKLPMSVLRYLGLYRKSGLADALKILGNRIGRRIRFYKGPRTTYLGRNLPLPELVYNRIFQKPGLSVGVLARQVPMVKNDLVASLNKLLETNRIRCGLNTAYIAFLHPVTHSPTPPSATVATEMAADCDAFKVAYDAVGHGSGYVRIHLLRERLQWSRERFDAVLKHLRRTYHIQLHGGDPALFSEAQIRGSFVDEKNRLRLTLNWKT